MGGGRWQKPVIEALTDYRPKRNMAFPLFLNFEQSYKITLTMERKARVGGEEHSHASGNTLTEIAKYSDEIILIFMPPALSFWVKDVKIYREHILSSGVVEGSKETH